MVSVWIALDDTRVENGCMHVIPGGHKLGPLRYFHGPFEGLGKDCQIVNGRFDVARRSPSSCRLGPRWFSPGGSLTRRRRIGPRFDAGSGRVAELKKENGVSSRDEIQTFFDLIDANEGRTNNIPR